MLHYLSIWEGSGPHFGVGQSENHRKSITTKTSHWYDFLMQKNLAHIGCIIWVSEGGSGSHFGVGQGAWAVRHWMEFLNTQTHRRQTHTHPDPHCKHLNFWILNFLMFWMFEHFNKHTHRWLHHMSAPDHWIGGQMSSANMIFYCHCFLLLDQNCIFLFLAVSYLWKWVNIKNCEALAASQTEGAAASGLLMFNRRLSANVDVILYIYAVLFYVVPSMEDIGLCLLNQCCTGFLSKYSYTTL